MSNCIDFPDETLAEMWRNFDWPQLEAELLKLQQKLTKSVFRKQHKETQTLQNKIVSSLKMKALAVHKITDEHNSGPGVDGVLWVSDADKMRGAMSLSPDNYQAQPFKRIIIQDKHKMKERRIGVPTVKDRAMQVLYTFALDPIAEATAERKSFAFRKGRSALDAHYFICEALKPLDSPDWLFIGDIKSCYESISHDWLLKNIPMDKRVLKSLLKAGFAFKNEIFPTEQGISLGANISPILGNMTLDGLQHVIFDNHKTRDKNDFSDGNLIRYADDIVITARTKESAYEAKSIVEKFLSERGLKLSEQKSKVIHTSEGFDFLSRNYCKRNGILCVTPSEKAIKSFEENLQNYILNHDTRWSQRGLIKGLNAKLQGWASYHRVEDATDAFRHIDAVVSALLLKLTQELYPTKTKEQLIEKFWYTEVDGTKVYALPDKKEVRIMHLKDVMLTSHQPMKTKANPYLDIEYFDERLGTNDISKANGKYKAIWERQNGRCYYCGEPIGTNQEKKIVFKRLSTDKTVKNMAYIHASCECDEIVLCHADIENPNELDVFDIVQEVIDKDVAPRKNKKLVYGLLEEFFDNCLKTNFTLSFAQIEKIMKRKLCESAYKYTSFWYKKGRGTLPDSWQSHGYGISKIDLKNKKVAFKKVQKENSKLKIPEVFLTDDIPNEAKYELEQFFDYIKKKYGI